MFDENSSQDIFFLPWYNLICIKKGTELSLLTLQKIIAAALQSSVASLITSSTGYIVTSQELHRFSWNKCQKYELGGRGVFLSERPVYDKFCCSQVFRENKALGSTFKSHNTHNKQVNLSKESWKWKFKGNCIVSLPWNTRIQILSVFSPFLSIWALSYSRVQQFLIQCSSTLK